MAAVARPTRGPAPALAGLGGDLALALGLGPGPAEPSLDDLIALAPTETLRERVASLTRERGCQEGCQEGCREGCREHGPELARARRDLERGRLRDAKLAACRGRGPAWAACWCLGQGGKHPVVLGPSPDGLDPPSGYRVYCACPAGAEAEAEAASTRAELAAQMARARAARVRGAARIPATYQGLTLETWARAAEAVGGRPSRVGAARGAIEGWYDRARVAYDGLPESSRAEGYPPPILMIAGKYGSGKTGAALAVLQRALDEGKSGVFWTMPEFLLALQATYDGERGAEGEWEILETARECFLLVLDDWGAEAATPRREAWMSERLHVVIEERLKAGRPTILTTNLPSTVIRDRISEQVFERLWPDRCSEKVVFGTPNLRAALSARAF